jgi:hypothetical protein
MTPSVACLNPDSQRQDPLRRLRPTPFVADLPLLERVIRFETNSLTILNRTRDLCARFPTAPHRPPDFLWRIVVDSSQPAEPPWPELSAFSDEGLRFMSFGHRNFIALDLPAKEAIGYLAEGLSADRAGFVSPFLNTLFVMTAGALRLTPLAGACVTMGRAGLVVLGQPNSGKTTASYLTARLGLEFYSDATIYLDFDHGNLRLWGDFSPACFRTETATYLPEIKSLGCPYRYRDLNFLYVEEGTSIPCNGHPVVPVACIFLKRAVASTPRFTKLNHAQSMARLAEYLAFQDDECFEPQHSAALAALARLPAYRLAYGTDPAVAATFLRNILMVNNSLVNMR